MSSLFERISTTPARWNSGTGPEAGVVHSTRVRLARNIEHVPFPHRADSGVLEKIKDDARRLVEQAPFLRTLEVIDLDQTGVLSRELLVERHLISREFAAGQGKLLLVDDAETVAVMVNEEDHFRFQVLRSGLDALEAWRILHQIEREADRHFPFAWHPPYGYLTACPTNIGTALRVSALCHLPALGLTGEIKEIANTAAQIGITVRGFFGEGSVALGNFYQFSNRTTLGRNELEIVHDLESWIRQVIDREIRRREQLIEKDRAGIEDKVYRAHGLLRSARLITAQEMMNLLSLVRLGLGLGILTDPDLKKINEVQLASQPAHLQKHEGRALSPAERDFARASMIRTALQ